MDVEIIELNKNDGEILTSTNMDTVDQNFKNIKTVLSNLTIPTATSQILNDSSYLTSPELTDSVVTQITDFNTNFNNLGGGVGNLATRLNNLQQQNTELMNLLDIVLDGQILSDETGQGITTEDGSEITL